MIDLRCGRSVRLRVEIAWRTMSASARNLCRAALGPREMRRLMSIRHERAARESMQAAALACRALGWLERETRGPRTRPGVRWTRAGRPVFTGMPAADLSRVGIDVEGRRALSAALLETAMCAEERVWIDAAPDPSSREERFANLWVLKEALCKADGAGLALDPLAICFKIENGCAQLLRSPVGGVWSFYLTQLPGGASCAFAAEKCGSPHVSASPAHP
jgi:phosphopantetheinyl transferase